MFTPKYYSEAVEFKPTLKTKKRARGKTPFDKLSKPGKVIFIIVTALVCILAVTMVFPFYWMFIGSLKSAEENMSTSIILWPSEPDWSIFSQLIEKYDIFKSMGYTMLVEVVVIPIGTFVSSLAAFAFAKMHFRFKKTMLILIMTAMMIPYSAVMLPQYRAFQSMQLEGIFVLLPLMIPGMFGRVSMIFFLTTYMKGAIHDSIVESARMDGASFFKIYYKIALPASKTALSAQIIFWFVAIWNDYFAPSLYLTGGDVRTLQVVLTQLNGDTSGNMGFAMMMGGSFISSIPMIIFFIIFRNFFIGNASLSGVKE